MLINYIREHETLNQFLCQTCEEHNISVVIDDRIENDDFEIIKPDDYYNSLKIDNRPAAPDCFILVRCQTENEFALSIVELKKVNKSANLERKDLDQIKAKFENCLTQFMIEDFPIFDRDFKKVELLFISRINPYRKNRDTLQNLKIKVMRNWRFEFRNKRYLLKVHLPSPAIKPCY
ncbi:MAG: hypothetical protein AB8G11_00715 [Saprospiraceae bacterium]